jgi:hypothetical protein
MQRLVLAAGVLAMIGGAAIAQPAPDAPPDTAPQPVHHHRHHHHHINSTSSTGGSGERPVDVGPNTPQANAAYQGGGVVLQGAPGAPAPRPMATPPGQVPANSLPP